IMGLQLPGSSFVNPGTELRNLLNEYAVKTMSELINSNSIENTISHIYDEKTVVNGIIGLLATGGSTNHTIHLIAMAKAAGININWQDFSDLSNVVPLIARVYPNGAADINHFHASGGMAFVIRTLLDSGLLHEDVNTIVGKGLEKYTQEPKIKSGKIAWEEGPKQTLNDSILRSVKNPFSKNGGIVMLKGNVGRSVIKTSAVDESNFVIEAPAIVFNEQEDLIIAFKNGELEKDFVAVFPFQGPKQNGMPELHKLTPTLTVLQKKGYRVALLTDGRMSGASGKVPAAIHLTPEAKDGGPISKIRTRDIIKLDAVNGTLNVLDESFLERPSSTKEIETFGLGRELFEVFRNNVNSSEEGATVFFK
ncbi:MAG: dihydroxy-acid dehydratase, partial [Bacteroidia bacterium]